MVPFSATPGGALRVLVMRGQGDNRMYRWALTIAVIVTFVGYALLSSPSLGDSFQETIGVGGLLVANAAASIALIYRTRHATGHRRRAWALVTSGTVLALAANVWLLYCLYAELTDLAKAFGDAALLLSLCIGAVGVLSFPTRIRRGTEAARMILDGIVVGGSVLYIVAVRVFPQLYQLEDSPRRLFLLLIPVADAALVTLAVLLILRSHRSDRPALALLSTGVVLYAAADLIYAVRFAMGDWAFGTLVDLLWLSGYAFFVLAALHPANESRRMTQAPREPSSVTGTLLVFGLFFAAAVITILPSDVAAPLDEGHVYQQAMWIGVLLAVAARQVLYVVDNRALRQSLELRVRERTAELSKITEQTELMLSSVGEGIYGVDRHGLVTFANPVAAHLLGCQTADLIGLPAHDAWHETRPDGTPYPVEDCYVTEAIRSGIRTQVAEDVYRRPDGSAIPVEVTTSPLSSSEGIQGAVVVFRDTTQRREVDRMKSEFVSVVSHELRTPLTAIRGSLGLLAGGALGEMPPRAGRMVSIALESSERLTRLINDILDLERIEAGTTPMDLADHSVAELVDGAVEQMSVIAGNAQVKLRVIAADGTVRANADRVAQTLLNLIGNAIKFSPEGTAVSVRAGASRDGDEIEFQVSDEGRGIPPDKLETIFKRFDQVDSSDAREKGGTGLGLAICKSIVERHGGRIWAESTPGAGSTFRFTLPRAAAPSHRPTSAEGPATVAVRGKDRAGTEAMCRALDAPGYRPIPTAAGEPVSTLTDDGPPAALVLDVGQSKSQAARVLAGLRSDAATRGLAVVVVSGWHPEDLPLIAAQANGWVIAPDEGEHLVQMVTAAILGQRAQGDVLVIETRHDEFGGELAEVLARRGLTVCHPRTKRQALNESADQRPHVLVLDRFIPNADVVALSAEMRDGGLLVDVPVIVYTAPRVSTGTGDDLRLGRTLFLDGTRVSVDSAGARIAELLGATTPR